MSAQLQNETLSVSAESRRRMLTDLLKSVSRAFYLSMRALPSGMREPVSVAYLLARAADTIADTTSLAVERRLAHLRDFREIVAGEYYADTAAELAAALSDLQPTDGERELLDALPGVFALLDAMGGSDAEKVRSVVLTLTSGMLYDLTTFNAEDSGELIALQTPDELDEYCYMVAGCVGEFWTALSIAHTPSLVGWDRREMGAIGVRFGLALQMTNILRDVPKDLRIGRCYLPQTELARIGLGPEDLLDANNAAGARPLLAWGIRRTLDRFADAQRYILAIPRRNLRLRLAALWPVLIGLATLAELARGDDWLNPDTRVKIPRRAVYGIIALSLLCGRSNTLLNLWFRRLAKRVESHLPDSLTNRTTDTPTN